MDIGNDKHQQLIKDLILSLHTGGEDSNPCMQIGSRSLSESSLNPNAAEFVPSYMKTIDVDDDEKEQQQQQELQQELQQHVHQQLQFQRTAGKNLNSTSTTLVAGVMQDTVIREASKEEKLRLIQRRLYKLMNQLGSQNIPLLLIQFSLTTNGNGVNVQFLSPESSKQHTLDKDLCQSACLRVDINEHGLQSTLPEFALARQFLDRMGDFLSSKKAQVNSSVVCSKCTGLGPKKHSYSELEIDRQIEDIKAFERLINEEEGARYQDAFKQLCLKLGVTQNSEQPAPLKTPSEPVQRTGKKEVKKELPKGERPRTEDNLSCYEWDPFIPELTTMKAQAEQKRRADSASPKEQKQNCVLPPSDTQGIISSTPVGPSSVQSKPLKKLSNAKSASRVAINTPKDKEGKNQPVRCSLAVVTATAAVTARSTATVAAAASAKANAKATATAAGAATTATPTATAANIATGAAGAVVVAGKKLQEQAHLNGRHLKCSSPCVTPTKFRTKEVSASPIKKPGTNCKQEPRPSLAKTKPQLDNDHVNKPIKAATLPRAGGVRQTQENKQQSSTVTQRVVAPRSTYASLMRQTEVKRRLSLMRSDDTDVKLKEYLFK